MSPPKESDDWSFKNFSNGFKKVMMTHPQFNDIGTNRKEHRKDISYIVLEFVVNYDCNMIVII